MHAVDPLQALRLLRHRLAELTRAEFHDELQRIFLGLRDLHTNYILPRATPASRSSGSSSSGASRTVEPSSSSPKTFDHITGDPQLQAGVEVTHWNGTPIELAVEAQRGARGRQQRAARQVAQGLQTMTLRMIIMSLPPDEDWVDMTYKTNGTTHETRVPWRVFESGTEVTTPGDPALAPAGIEVDPAQCSASTCGRR